MCLSSEVKCRFTSWQSANGVSVLTRKWHSLLLSYSFFTLKVSSWWLWRSSVFWLSLFFPRSLQKNSWCRWASPLAWHCRLSANRVGVLFFFPLRAEGACAVRSSRDVSVFSGCLSTRPLSSALSWPVCQQCKQPSIPGARGEGRVSKKWRDDVKYREIQQRESKHTRPLLIFSHLENGTTFLGTVTLDGLFGLTLIF